MRLTPRLGFRLILVVFAVVVICVRLIPRHRVGPAGSRVISDLAATSPLNQPGGDPALAEAYEVYSALYQAPSQTPTHEPLVFADNSVTDIPQVGGSCLKTTTPDEHEMANAFVVANRQSHRWEQSFIIPRGYRLLDSSEVAQAQNCIVTHGQDSAGCAGYQQVRHIRFLGVPGFDRTHTHALVSVIKNCGGDCGSGGIFAVEKAGGTWQRSASTDFTSDCSWVY
jgi:hypothetical protein